MDLLNGFKVDSNISVKRKKHFNLRNPAPSCSRLIFFTSVLFLISIFILIIFSIIKSSQVTSLLTEIETLQHQLNSQTHNNNEFSSQLSLLTQEHVHLKDETTQNMQTEQTIAQDELKLAKSLENFNDELSSLKLQLRTYQHQLDEEKETNNALNKQLKSNTMDIETYKELKAQYTSIINNLQNKINKFKHISSDINNDNNGLSLSIDSKLITTTEQLEMLSKWIDNYKIQFKLLYRASRDGFNAETFHSKCNAVYGLGAVVLIKDEMDVVFGGFTKGEWDFNGIKPDKDAFVFNINDKKKFNISFFETAIASFGDYIIVFGQRDLVIKEREGSSEFPFTYNTDNPFRLELTKGRGRFIVEEIEVFDIKQIR